MVRHADPRRPEKSAAAALFFSFVFSLAVLFSVAVPGLAVLGLAGPAHAAGGGEGTPNERAERTKGASTVLGAPNASECAIAAAAGRADDAAAHACDRAINTERLNRANRVATLTNRGAVHLRRRAGEAALADFDAVIALDRKNPEAYVNRGAALVMVGRPGPAVAAFTNALSLGVRDPHKAYFNRGAAREALGDIRGAFEDYTTALTIKPDWGVAEAELARFVRGRRERLAARLGESPLPASGQQ